MALNDIKFTKTNGGMGRTAANEDPVSGLIMGLEGIDVSKLTGFDKVVLKAKTDTTDEIALYTTKLRFFEQLAGLGITEQILETSVNLGNNHSYTSDKLLEIEKELAGQYKHAVACNTIVYHVKEFFRMNNAGTLYFTIKTGNDVESSDIEKLQDYSGGIIRQVAVFTKELEVDTINLIDKYQEVCANTIDGGLEAKHKPLSVVVGYCGISYDVNTEEIIDNNEVVTGYEIKLTKTKIESETEDSKNATLAKFTKANDYILKDRCNVSLVISCDLDTNIIAKLGPYAYYSCIGTTLGAISKASVHECIAWVQKFPLSLSVPGFISGDVLRNVSNSDLELINDQRYIFVRTHVGDANNYFNDSYTLDVETSDYAYIENVRTMDKACRGIRTNLLPYLNSPLHVNATTGKMQNYVIENLKTVAGKTLELMEQAGELSGYIVDIDPDQNVVSNSTVEFVIKKVGVGVMRHVRIQIGYTTQIS
ncbi:MAG: DUF2586 domain-containing protein [Bacteroidales bacterium]|jgi:hypothetical protein|nr:DUF2586 domain-containing protein [Bacteroidales bacterium]